MRKTSIIINLLYLLILLTLTGSYISWRLEAVYGLPFGWGLGAYYTILLSAPVTAIIEREWPKTRWLYHTSMVLVGTALILLPVLAIEHVLPSTGMDGSFTITLLAIGILFSQFEAESILTKRYTIPIHGLKKKVELLQLTDLHAGAIKRQGFLERVVEQTNRLRPNLVVLTGDIFDGSGQPGKKLIKPLQGIKAKTIAVLGNHDQYIGADKSATAMEALDITVLRRTTTTAEGLEIIGMDCPLHDHWKLPNERLRKLRLGKKKKPRILLYHTPSGLDDAKAAKVDLMLSGHTHKGQLFPFTLLIKQYYRYYAGLYTVGAMKLYVSQGTGTWGPPMRLGSRSEMTLFTLIPQD